MKIKTRVLHIDDNTHDRELVRDALLKEPDEFEILEAGNRADFERHLAEADFDIIVSDYNILGFEGLKVLQIVKDKYPEMPVIIVTGTGSEEIAINAMKMGATDYIIKSVNNLRGLGSTIKIVIDYKKAQTERRIALDKQHETEELYRSVFENTSVAILLTTSEGKVISANEYACVLFGRSKEELWNTERNKLIDTSDPRVSDLVIARKRTGHAQGEMTFIKKDGTRFTGEASSVVFRDKEENERITLVIRDLSEQKKAEEALVQNEKKYRHIFENNPLPMWIYDPENLAFLEVNNAALNHYGYTKEEFAGMTLADIRPAEDLTDLKLHITRTTVKNTSSGIFRHIKKSSEVIFVEITSHKIKYDGKNVRLVLSNDITKSKQATEELRKLSQAVEQNPASIIITNLKGDIEYVNPKFSDITGYTREEAIGKNPRILKSGSTPVEIYKDLWNTITAGKDWKGELQNLKKNGEAYFEMASISPIINEEGKITNFLAVKEDITERKKNQEALRISEEKYRGIFENVQDVFFQVDLKGFITDVSPSIFKISGFKREELIGTQIENMHYNLEERRKMLQLLEQENEIWDYEIQLVSKDKHVGFYSINIHKMFDTHSNQIGVEGSIHDINERKKFENDLIMAKEKAEENDKLKTAFLHNITHEIRTPMNAIIGFSDLLGEPEYSPEMHSSFIETIQSSSNQLLSIIDDIVNISSIEAKIIKTNNSALNINTELKSLYNQFSIKASNMNVILQYKTVLVDESALIHTDKIKLFQILSNLINNAFKFTNSGKIEFGYVLKDSYLEFYVSDTGIGIPKDEHFKIFDTFYQVENTLERQFEGTGLGLSICKAYTELLGGKIWLDSEPGKGSVFYFTIPYKPVKTTLISANSQTGISENGLNNSYTVLVAEDDNNSYKLIESILTTINARVIRAETGKEAVEKCKSVKNIDLVLMDIKMSGGDGYFATKNIRKFLPDIPILAQTAYAADREKVLECGCNDFISKPFTRIELLSKINSVLKVT